MAAADSRLRYVHIDEAGLSARVQQGIQRTEGDVLAFTDDDCIVPTDWLRDIVAAFAAEPDGDLLYGQVLPAGHDQRRPPADAVARDRVPERLSQAGRLQGLRHGRQLRRPPPAVRPAGPFDEVLGGGGPLWSSQDFDLAYRTYKAGGVILLRPEVYVRHDGRREAEDWPALLLAYGSGDGAFYMKHVRCRDPYALWLFSRQARRYGRPLDRQDDPASRQRTATTSAACCAGREAASGSRWTGGLASTSSAERTLPHPGSRSLRSPHSPLDKALLPPDMALPLPSPNFNRDVRRASRAVREDFRYRQHRLWAVLAIGRLLPPYVGIRLRLACSASPVPPSASEPSSCGRLSLAGSPTLGAPSAHR